MRAFDFTSRDAGPLAYRLEEDGRSVSFSVSDDGDYVNALLDACRPIEHDAICNIFWRGKSEEERAWGRKVEAWLDEILDRYCTEEWLERVLSSRESARSAAPDLGAQLRASVKPEMDALRRAIEKPHPAAEKFKERLKSARSAA